MHIYLLITRLGRKATEIVYKKWRKSFELDMKCITLITNQGHMFKFIAQIQHIQSKLCNDEI